MSGEFEPNDSRNVTGTASTPDGHWTAQGQQPPLANGQPPQPTAVGGGGLSDEGEGERMENRNMGSESGRSPFSGSLGEQIREHMRVVDAEGAPVGTVDAFENDQIKLTRSGSADGQHHYLPIDRVAGIEGETIRLHQSGDDVFGSNGS